MRRKWIVRRYFVCGRKYGNIVCYRWLFCWWEAFLTWLLIDVLWTHEIQYQPWIDLMEIFCNLGNQIGPSWRWLQPCTTKNIGILTILHQSGTAHEKVDPAVTILNVNTSLQRLRPIYISYGKTISASNHLLVRYLRHGARGCIWDTTAFLDYIYGAVSNTVNFSLP